MRIVTQVAALFTIVCASINSGYAQANNSCGLEMFQCHDGECIADELLCDGKANCKDQSDETASECTEPGILCPDYAFRCEYGACVNIDTICNGIKDCIDNSDETLPRCMTGGINNQTERPERCKPNEFTCGNGECIVSLKVCDGKRDCADSSDEVYARCGSLFCPPIAFRCNYGACIDIDQICDGINNCVDGSDEDPKSCGASNWPSLFPPVTSPTIYPTPTYPTIALTPGLIKYCEVPAQPPNGHWKLHRSQCLNDQDDCNISEGLELPLGSHLTYSCNPGYKLRGSVDVSCSANGKWINIPVCIEIRCISLSTASTEASCTYNAEWVSCELPVLPRTTAALTCRNGYRRDTSFLTQRDHVRCNLNGQWEPEPIRCIPVCGTLPPNITPLISDGRRPNITEFPWHASMYRENASGKKVFFCGASIIRENLLITAAHCVYDERTRSVIKDPSKIHIVTGNIFRDYDSRWHDERLVKKNQVKNIYIVCNYLGLVGNFIWDIAILELVQPFVLSSWLVPICLDPVTYGDQTVLVPGSYGKVAGFGRTAISDSSVILQYLTVPYVSYSQCKAASPDTNSQRYITIDKFCAGYTNGSSACEGDSGGGLAFKSGGLWYLRGVLSIALSVRYFEGNVYCDNNLSLYTRISSHIGWILDVIATLEQNRPYPSCSDKS